MPQLIPTPWFAILILSWLVFLAVVVPKILSRTYPNLPTSQSTEKPKNNPWFWTWH
uniref:ATP synthase complex subunit 8 n=1 Tax=Zeugopterus punctatus TaxID=526623 RepID=A0A7G9M2I1_9PLEU|nr:ATP synthase F0 subunit 8 [Zeugopterus punctatus]QNM99549.1 ATP synthase F0 subunit 8 [Zeugopterus punctatus]